MKEKFQRMNIPVIMFSGFSIRLIALGASWGDAIPMLALAGVYAYHKYLNQKNILWTKTVEKEIVDLKNIVSGLNSKISTKTIHDSQTAFKDPNKRFF